MEEFIRGILTIILVALIYWGIGSLTTIVFGINYVWTFWHGLVVALIKIFVLGEIE